MSYDIRGSSARLRRRQSQARLGCGAEYGPYVLKIERRRTFLTEGMPAHACYEIVNGTVILYKELPGRRRQILDVLGPGSWFGIAFGLHHTCSAEALTATTLRVHDRGAIQRSYVLQERMVAEVHKALEAAQNHAVLLGRKTAVERIATFLLNLASLHSQPAGERTRAMLAVPMKQSDIGDYLGLTVETVSRTITLLKKRMIIATGKRGHFKLLNIEALQRIAQVNMGGPLAVAG
jgi:CRP-like cAMP-binding protein